MPPSRGPGYDHQGRCMGPSEIPSLPGLMKHRDRDGGGNGGLADARADCSGARNRLRPGAEVEWVLSFARSSLALTRLPSDLRLDACPDGLSKDKTHHRLEAIRSIGVVVKRIGRLVVIWTGNGIMRPLTPCPGRLRRWGTTLEPSTLTILELPLSANVVSRLKSSLKVSLHIKCVL